MKSKRNKNFIIIVLVLAIGFFIGFFTKSMFFQKNVDGNSNANAENSLSEKIKSSKYNTENINNLTTELDKLENRLEEINSEKRDIEAKISTLKNRINNSTNQEFEDEIFPEESEEEKN